MRQAARTKLPSIVLSAVFVLLTGLILLAFFVPRLMSHYDESGQAMTGWQRALGQASGLAVNSGYAVLPILMIALIGAIVWRVRTLSPGATLRAAGRCVRTTLDISQTTRTQRPAARSVAPKL